MITFSRGGIATIVFLSTLAAGCPADEPNDEPTASSTDTDPSTTDPATSDPATTDPATTDPATTDPATTDPATTDPATTDDPSTSTTDEATSTAETTGDESTTDAAGLEIIGDWADGFGGVHAITETSWVTSYGEAAYPYTISEYDNAERWIIAQDDGDESWSKYEWTYVEDALWYCQTTFGESSAEDAIAFPDADATDPAADGCGGFAWSLLTPRA